MARHTKTMWTHVRRSPYQALAAVSIMMLTFLTATLFTFLLVGSERILSYFESKPQVIAFFRDEATQNDINALKAELQSSEKVANIKFVSKRDALGIYRQQNKNDPALLELVTADILPASLEISSYTLTDLPAIASALNKSQIIKEVVYPKDVVSKLAQWTSIMRKIGVGIIAVLGLVSISIMITIIGIKISQRREEIEIMRLIGATNWYISLPFLYEGILYATTGALLGWAIGTAGLLYATPALRGFLGDIPLLPVSQFFLFGLLGIEVLVALFFGWFASVIAVNRYLQ